MLTRRTAFCLGLFAAALLFASTPEQFASQAAPPPTMDDVLKNWRERERRIATVTFHWNTRQTLTKGSILNEETAKGLTWGGGKPFDLPVPPKDITHTFPSTLLIKNNKARYDRSGWGWSPERKEFVPHTYSATFDGTQSATYLSPGPVDHGRGFISADMRHPDIGHIYLLPVLALYRPFSPTLMGFSADHYRMSPEQGVIDGRSCVLVEELASRAPASRMAKRIAWWLDPERGYIPLRYTHTHIASGKMTAQLTISYHRKDDGHLVPLRWTVVLTNPDGSLRESSLCEVTGYELNGVMDDERFTPSFPRGTIVYDHRTQSEYIIRQDGSHRTIEKWEYGPETSYQSLVATDPGRKFPWRSWLGVGNFVLLLLLGFLLFWTYLRPRRRQMFSSRGLT